MMWRNKYVNWWQVTLFFVLSSCVINKRNDLFKKHFWTRFKLIINYIHWNFHWVSKQTPRKNKFCFSYFCNLKVVSKKTIQLSISFSLHTLKLYEWKICRRMPLLWREKEKLFISEAIAKARLICRSQVKAFID